MDEEEVTTVSREMETERTERVESGNSKEVGTENSEKAERKVKRKNIAGILPTGSGAAKSETGTKIKTLKPEMKKYCFHPRHVVQRPRRRVGA